MSNVVKVNVVRANDGTVDVDATETDFRVALADFERVENEDRDGVRKWREQVVSSLYAVLPHGKTITYNDLTTAVINHGVSEWGWSGVKFGAVLDLLRDTVKSNVEFEVQKGRKGGVARTV
jgi:hypothetical protein